MKALLKPAHLLTVSDLQQLNRDIYLVQNDRNYSTHNMVSRLHRYTARLLQSILEENTDVGYCLCMSLSWLMAIANRFHIDAMATLQKQYPKYPKCGLGIPDPFQILQKTLIDLYPLNTNLELGVVALLSSNVGKLNEAVEHYQNTHDSHLFKDVEKNLVEVIRYICAVATRFGLDISEEMTRTFQNGCPKCGEIPCIKCGFTVAKMV